ncbi:MAG: hypothetical protein QOK37_2720 [Thermoanaerobaculia bacterium]|jgi:hypothetical protein|nr:hypothetical protein [Thermoanaerobaculia bacterium]
MHMGGGSFDRPSALRVLRRLRMTVRTSLLSGSALFDHNSQFPMPSPLESYLASRSDTATFLLGSELGRTVDEIFPRADTLLPKPYKIFPADETQSPSLGFPVADVPVLRELDAKLDRWLSDEIAWQAGRQPAAKEKAQLANSAYMTQLVRVAENALMSNLLSDYHAVFWLAHSFDLARQWSSIPRRVSLYDAQTGKTQGDAFKYRIFAKWANDTREAMAQLATKASSILDGEEQRGLQFFKLLADDVLIFTEEFIGPDLRELRSFVNGYLRRDFQAFRDSIERMREICLDLLQRDRTFRASLPLFGAVPDQGISIALLLDTRFQNFLFDQNAIQSAVTREDREQFQLIARRIREFAILNQLRRGITMMTVRSDDQIVSTDKRATVYSRSTRPMDFGRQGVVDPMVHRFGLIYDISNFTETLGNIRRGGRKEEISSYRQMLLFQRKLDSIAGRHLLQFEKFLGDGAFYTTRRALRLVRAAVEIQRCYAEIRRKGFAFNKGLRIALNFGYYRLLPMKGTGNERITEFYGPGIVELSRLTTGKANKEIDEFASFLLTHGYESSKVQAFFAPLARGVDVIDHTQHAREFYAYVNASGHLVNEGIVASFSLLQELSNDLASEGQQLFRLRSPWATYIGFAPSLTGLEYIGIRLIGMVSLKGLDEIDVGEIVPFAPGDVEAIPIDGAESLLLLVRQEFHQDRDPEGPLAEGTRVDAGTTSEQAIESELVICMRNHPDGTEDDVVIGEWNPRTDELHCPLRFPHGDFVRLFSIKGDVTAELLSERRETVRDLYNRLADRTPTPAVPLAEFRDLYATFVLGAVVEKL